MLSKYRFKISSKRDERIRLTNELIQGIHVIKLYAWEKPFSKIIKKWRNNELKFIKISSYMKGVHIFYNVLVITSIFTSITLAVLLNHTIDAKVAFVTTALFSISGTTLTTFLPNGIAALSEIHVSINRITAFLLCDETGASTRKRCDDYAVMITNGCLKWDNQNTFTNVNIKIQPGTLTAVIGSVGCGKSSLLQIILGELHLNTGDLGVNGKISYASQEPWIFPSTIRQNILFGSQMNELRYNHIIRCCELEEDFKLFPHGDKTIVGEHGASVSGGQKARINLARAIYREADIYLLDDPLSAVDTRVGKSIFENCIQTMLKQNTVLLATHHLQYLKDADHVIVIENRSIKIQSARELKKSDFAFEKYPPEDPIIVSIERLDSIPRETLDESEAHLLQNLELTKKGPNTGFISFSTYGDYLLACGSFLLIGSTILCAVLAQFSSSSSYYFVAYWLNMEQESESTNHKLNRNTFIYVYIGVTVATFILIILKLKTFVDLTMESSKNLHNRMFNNLVHASTRFFNLHTSGRILNRFTKDLVSIDELLPSVALIAITSLLIVFGTLCVICIVNPWFILPTTVVVFLCICIRKFYSPTNLNILRAEGNLRGPLYGYVQASLQGLSTIRTFDVQEKLINEFNHHLDTHSTALHMSYGVSRAFGYTMDIICFIYITLVILYYIYGSESYSGNVGLVICQAIGLVGILSWGARQLTLLENYMVSVERILEYNLIEKERALESSLDKKPPAAWPDRGEIIFNKVYLKYSPSGQYVLKNLNFTIQPLEKVGIVGRTGAGKTSLISTLFQLVEIEGSIIIDKFDITNIGLHDLRKNMSIIPQNPFLFSGTVRNNLDPFNEFDDATLWKALDDVRLKDVINTLNLGLSSVLSQDGSNLSLGQRQLICLARAIVRNKKILILDEATANVDLRTDEIIQETIRKKFVNCTVITVAHRLHTIIDSDRVLVMDAGEIAQFDHPYVLLQNIAGIFYNMIHQTEKGMADDLASIARASYKRKEDMSVAE